MQTFRSWVYSFFKRPERVRESTGYAGLSRLFRWMRLPGCRLAAALVALLAGILLVSPAPLVAASGLSQETPVDVEVTHAPDACTVYWNVDADGFWDVASNWSTGIVPGSGSTACLNRPSGVFVVTIRQSTGTVGIVQSHEVLRVITGGSITVGQVSNAGSGIQLEGGTVSNGAGSWQIGGASSWAAGTINDQVTITGTLTLSTTVTKVLGGTLTNAGTVIHAGGDLDSTTINNLPGAIYDFQGDAQITTSSNFYNQGTLKKTGGAGVSGFAVNASFHNQGGLIQVTSGQLSVGAGTSTGGTFTVSPGAVLNLYAASTPTLGGAYSGSGGGEVRIGGFSTAVPGATFTFPAGMLHWVGGAVSATATRPFVNAGTLTLSTAATKTLSGQLDNQGAIVHVQGDLDSATVNNLPGAIYDFQGDALITTSSYFYNQGTLKKSGGAGVSGFGANAGFYNQGGAVEVTSGQLTLGTGGGANTGGAYSVSPGAVLDLTGGGSPSYTGTTSGSGGGEVRLAGGTLSTVVPGATFDFPAGMLQWSGGTISAAASRPFVNVGTLTLSGAGVKTLSGQLDNQGAIVHIQGDLDSATVNNLPGAIYDFQGDALITTSSYFYNQGALKKTGGAGVSGFGANAGFYNQGGAVEATSGTLSIGLGGGTVADASFVVGPGATVDLTGGGTPLYQGAFSGQGDGTLLLASGSLRLGGASQVTIDFPPGLFHWTGGTLTRITDGPHLTNLGSLTIAGNNPHTLTGVTITNQGQIIHSDDGIVNVSYAYGFKNMPGALYDLQGDGDFGGGYGIFANFGELRKSAGTGESTFGIQFDSKPGGVVNVQSGEINLAAGTSSPFNIPGATGGVWNVAAGALLEISRDVVTNNSYTLTGYFTGSGPGVVRIRGYLSNGNAPAPVFDFPEGALEITDGSYLYGEYVNDGYLHLVGSGEMRLRGTLTNNGVIRHSGGGPFRLYGFSIVENYGLYDLQTDADISIFGYWGNPTFRNFGEFRKSGGLGVTQFYDPENFGVLTFDNQGTLAVQAGTVQFDEAVAQVSGNTLTGGMWVVAPFAAINIASAGSLTTNQGEIVLSGPSSTFSQINTLGNNQGSLTLDAGRSLSPPAGFSNSGELTLGPGSTLAVNGAFAQVGGGSVTLQIGGSPGSGQYGRITASGSATLTDTLAIELANGYGPSAGQQYNVLTYASRSGQFQHLAGLHPFFTAVQGATAVTLNGIGTAADLAVAGGSIGFPGSGAPGQAANVSFTVQNLDGAAIPGSWMDSVYLSKDAVYSSDDLLLGRVQHNGGLGGSASYNAAVNAPLPGLVDGDHYVVVISDSQTATPDRNRANNQAAAGPMTLTAANLPFNATTPGTVANGQDRYLRLDVPPAAGDVRLSATFAVANQAELYVRYGAMPTRSTFDYTASNLLDLQRVLTLASPQAGPHYILVHGRQGAGGGQGFSLLAETIPFALTSSSPGLGSNAGNVTLTIRGTGFSPDASISLSGPSSVNATTITYASPNTLFATFDLAGKPDGSYTLAVSNSAGSGSLPGALQVIPGSRGEAAIWITSPGNIRSGRRYVARVHYRNIGLTDIPAPLMIAAADNALIKLPEQPDFITHTVPLLGVNWDGPAGVLPPGYEGSIALDFIASGSTRFDIYEANPAVALDWQAIKNSMKPAFVSPTAWDAIYTNMLSQVGPSVGHLAAALADNANYLGALDERTADANQLMGFELLQADHFGELSQRYTTGALGLGWNDPTEARAVTDGDGNVVVRVSGQSRPFRKLPGAAFRGTAGETGTLTALGGGAYRLREQDGRITVFKTDGTLDYWEDPAGNRITAGYSGGRLATLTDEGGDVFTYSYNPNGTLSQVTNASGGISSFTYDGSGRLHTWMLEPGRVITTTYVTGQGLLLDNAVSSTTFPDGEMVSYQYDGQGRLTSRSAGGIVTNYTYDAGAVTTTNAAGDFTTLFLRETGQLSRVLDSLGQEFRLLYDPETLGLARVTNGTGLAYSFERDENGLLSRLIDPLGQTLDLFVDPDLGRLTTGVDARGNSVQAEYDAAGNLLRLTQVDGAADRYTYDAAGRLLSATNRRDQQIAYTRNADGRLTQKDYPDGTSATFTYNAQGNLLTATNPLGTTTFGYDSLGRLASAAGPLGHTINYAYDSAGRRTRIWDETGFEARYTYDGAGRLSRVRNASDALLASYTYDATGRLSRLDNGNGTYSTYSYNDAGQLLSVENRAAGGALQSSTSYTYDANGRRATQTSSAGQTVYGYDAAGQLTSAALPGRTLLYSYDAAGNRINVNDNGSPTIYAANEINAYTAVGPAALDYDADGNLVHETVGPDETTYQYDAEGKLLSVTAPGDSWSYEYDALGQLIASVHNGERREYLPNFIGVDTVFAEYDGADNLLAHYVHGDGLVGRFDGAGNPAYYGYDGRGNTVQLTDNGGAVANQYAYLPFGEPLSASETISNPFTFGGMFGMLQAGAGRTFAQQRFYRADWGRFLTPDPLQEPGVNRYTYAANDPVNRVDFAGLEGETVGGPSFISDVAAPIYGGAVNSAQFLSDRSFNQLADDAAYKWVDYNALVDQGRLTDSLTEEQRAMDLEQQAGKYTDLSKKLEPLGNLSDGLDYGQFGLTLYEYKLGQADLLDVIHDGGLAAADLASNGPGAFKILKFAGVIDTVSQEGFGRFFDSYYEIDQDQLFSEDALRRLRDASTRRGRSNSNVVASSDPNDIIGPAGFGAPRWIGGSLALDYMIRFENVATATAPAQEVLITQQLDADLDWNSFEVGSFGWGNLFFDVPPGRQYYTVRLDLRDSLGYFVDFEAGVNLATGVATWRFASIDPLTGDLISDPLLGFLPPNVAAPEGEGFVNYALRPKASATTGTAINAQASIVFDTNPAILTPLWSNTLDVDAPTSGVTSLPPVSPPTFTVSWSGNDGSGSGVGGYDVYISDNGAPFVAWQSGVTATSASFGGSAGHSYGFYSVATDNAGNRQIAPPAAQATTTVQAMACADVQPPNGVGIEDIQAIAGRWGLHAGDPGWNPLYDLDFNNVIDVTDIAMAASTWETDC
jgi:RHS repeat-associated protein